ncbi:MAG: 4Fe-4S binding protein [Mangrovibacterium sp.]
MAKIRGAIVVDTEACKGCELCMVSCQQDVIVMSSQVNGKGYHFPDDVNREACTGCTNCAMVCPDSCITVYRAKLD